MATCPHCGRPYLFCVCRGLHRAGSARPSFHEVWGPKPMPHQAHTFSIFRAVLVAFRRDMRARAGRLTETPAEENAAVIEKFGCSEISLKRGRKRAKETQLAEARS